MLVLIECWWSSLCAHSSVSILCRLCGCRKGCESSFSSVWTHFFHCNWFLCMYVCLSRFFEVVVGGVTHMKYLHLFATCYVVCWECLGSLPDSRGLGAWHVWCVSCLAETGGMLFVSRVASKTKNIHLFSLVLIYLAKAKVEGREIRRLFWFSLLSHPKSANIIASSKNNIFDTGM